uniref:Uncharacterized protein n=1 Tax=Arundo donax TaxID=35708 RepID=A0A0A9PL84_ARUDO
MKTIKRRLLFFCHKQLRMTLFCHTWIVSSSGFSCFKMTTNLCNSSFFKYQKYAFLFLLISMQSVKKNSFLYDFNGILDMKIDIMY